MTKVKIIAITGATDTISESFRKYLSNIMERMKSRKYRKQPFWTLHTYCGVKVHNIQLGK